MARHRKPEPHLQTATSQPQRAGTDSDPAVQYLYLDDEDLRGAPARSDLPHQDRCAHKRYQIWRPARPAPWERAVLAQGVPFTAAGDRRAMDRPRSGSGATAKMPGDDVPAWTAPTVPAGLGMKRGAHRRTGTPRVGGRTLAASVAVGALLATGSTATAAAHTAGMHPETALQPDSAESDTTEGVQALVVPELLDLNALAAQLVRAQERDAARAAAARRPISVLPVSGTLTSSYGARWGTTHYGLDIANAIGTPIVSVTDGEVIESGPAAGFGLWVRIRQDDGTIGVYGHMDETLVAAGQRVTAGQQIATVGNRGQSTGPHLHYEVWLGDGTKADPMAWLNARGIQIGSADGEGAS